MYQRCAWCGLALGLVEPLEDPRVTHSICPLCRDRFLQQAGVASAAQPRRQADTPRAPVASSWGGLAGQSAGSRLYRW